MSPRGASSDGRPARVAREAGCLFAYFLGAAIFTFPLVLELNRAVTDLADPLINTWAISWVIHQLPRDPLHLFQANVLYPHPASLAFFDHMVGIALLVAPIELVFRQPVATHNVALLLSIALSGYGVSRLVRDLSGSAAAGAVAGSIFAFAPYRLGQLSHIQLQAAGFIPLLYLCLSRYLEQGRRRHAAGVALCLWFTSASCGYYGVFTWILLGVAVPYEAIRTGVFRRPRRLLGLGLALTLSALAYFPLALPYIRRSQEGFGRSLERMVRPSADMKSYLRTRGHLHQAVGLKPAGAEENLFPGFLALGLAAIALLQPSRLSGLYLAVGAAAVWASMGPAAGLYSFLFRFGPGVSALRVPARFGIYVLFALSVLAGLATAKVLGRLRGRQRSLVATALALFPLVESFGGPIVYDRAPGLPSVYGWLAARPEPAPVVELPMPACDEFRRNAVYMLWSTAHFKPLAFSCQLAAELERFPDEAGMNALRRLGVRWVILHRNLYLRARGEQMERALNRERGLKQVHRTDYETVYEVTPQSSRAGGP